MYASQHCPEVEKDLVGKWQRSVLPQVVRVDDSRRRTATHHHAMMYGVVYIYYIHYSRSDYLCSTASLLDAAPAWQRRTTRVERCSAISVICAV